MDCCVTARCITASSRVQSRRSSAGLGGRKTKPITMGESSSPSSIGPDPLPARHSLAADSSTSSSNRLRVRPNLVMDDSSPRTEVAFSRDTITTDILGLGQAMVDLCATIKDSTLEDLSFTKGSRNQCTQSERSLILESLTQDGEYTLSPGGSLSNSLTAISRLARDSLTIGMAGNIGSDALGGFYTRELRNSQIRWVNEVRQHTSTGTVIVVTTPDAQRTMISHRGSCDDDFVLGDTIVNAVTSTRVLVIEGYLLEIPGGYDSILNAIAHAKSAGALVALTAADASCVTRHSEEFWSLIDKGVDILFANDKEACELVGCDNVNSSTDELGHHIPLVSVTCGAAGSAIILNGQREKIAPNRKGSPAIDTCGAGDAYAAGLLYGLFNGADVYDMGNIAALVASYVVRKSGAALTEGDASKVLLSFKAIGNYPTHASNSNSVARALNLPYPRCSRVRLGKGGDV